MRTLLLASTSPRRRDLLAEAGLEFTVIPPGPEARGRGRPDQLALLRARGKASGVVVDEGLILGVDTVVDLDGEELGKPADRDAARTMLQRLSGKTHLVHTGHCLLSRPDGSRAEALSTSTVSVRAIPPSELEAFLDGGTWRGKAGAYGIQDPGTEFVELVAGDLDTVVGLSVAAVRDLVLELEGR